MDGTIEPGEPMEGQFDFGARKEAASFELIYNHGFSDGATGVTWEFTADEASNG